MDGIFVGIEYLFNQFGKTKKKLNPTTSAVYTP